jgi:hypothetical protein
VSNVPVLQIASVRKIRVMEIEVGLRPQDGLRLL